MNLTGLLVPTSLDAKQALRLRRVGFAAVCYALGAALLAVGWAFAIVPASTALESTGAYLAINAGLYAVFRSGFNLRFKDPSLTRFQILVAITVLMHFIYHLDGGRDIALLACFIIFLFGVFSMSTREFVVVTLYTLAAYALVIGLLMQFRPQAIQNVLLEWMSWLMLAAILPCFAAIGGHINALRLGLREREARFRGLTQLSSDFYWETDAGHRMVAVTYGPQHRAVVPKGSHVGKTRWELPYIHPDEAGWAAYRATLDAHLMFRDFELGRLGPDREERHLSISGEPMFDAAGGFKGYRGIGRDITVRKRAEQLLGLEHTVARCLSEADGAAAGIQAVIRAICESENWEAGQYWRVDAAAGVLRFGGYWGAAGAKMVLALGDSDEVAFAPGAGVAGRVWQSGQPLWIADTTNDPRVVRKDLACKRGIRGVFAFPVMSEGITIGVLAISSPDVRKPDEGLLTAVRVIGSQVGQFLQSKQAEQAIAHQAMQQGLIAAFGQQALASTNLDELLDQAVVVAGRGLDAGFCRMLQPGPDGSSLVAKAGAGWSLDRAGGRSDETDSMSQFSYVLASREPVVIEDFALETRFVPSALLVAHGIRSGVEVSIGGASGKLGVLGVYSIEQRQFAADSANFLQSLANTLATAIERQSAEQRLVQLAQFDTLTGLPNRNLFLDRFAQTLAQSQRNSWLAGVMFVDLDRFKAVNDKLGHGIGDQLLIQTAQRLRECVRAADIVARLGGDEFALVFSNLARADDAGLVAQKVVSALARAFDLEGREVYVSASVGICIYPDDGTDVDVLLKNADTAMYRAKERGRNTYQFYLPHMNERALARMEMETQLRGALARGEFVLHYQPKANLASGEICGFEALLRWQHPGRGLVPPLEFISILEDTGLIVPVGEWVVRTVCEQLGRWRAAGLALRPVAVNMSARQFHQEDLDAVIGGILQATGIDPPLLELELTESMLMSDPEAAVITLKNLKAYGVRLSVDDFGTGYSSLSYLKRFPLDALKIDHAFVRDVITDADDAAIAVAIISLAHNLKLKVVAEGVETEAQLNFLRAHGCDEMQGYYFARPLPIADCTRALNEDRRLPGPDLTYRSDATTLRLVKKPNSKTKS